jgi:hypothetical protein
MIDEKMKFFKFEKDENYCNRPFAAIHRYFPVCYLRQKAAIPNRQNIQNSELSMWSLSTLS